MGHTIAKVCRRFGWLLLIGVLLGGRDARAATDVCYMGGALLPNFKLNGDATLNGTDLIVTPAVGTKVASIMYLPKFSSAADIHVKLQVKISQSGNGGADGMAFVMHNDPRGTTAIGASGGGIGYQGIANSVVVEFDTYNNGSALGDLSANHIAITRNGDPNHSSTQNNIFPAQVNPTPIDMKSGNPVYLWIDWNHTTKGLTVYIATTSTKPASASMTAANIDLATMIGSTFYVGFTGSTGGSWNQHEVLELYASDHNADPVAACCSTNADCAASSAGTVCDTTKHLCGACTLASAGSCAGTTPSCDLSQSSNNCSTACNGNNGSTATQPCGSSAFPACNAAGSCSTCNGDYQTAASVKCLSSAPYCSPNGYCGRCTQNSDCSDTTASHTGSTCNTTTGACLGGPGDACTVGTTCASGICGSDSKCGYPNGTGPCTSGNAATVCRSGVCGASLKCVPAGGNGCAADSDCTTGNFCNGTTFTCTPKLGNSTALPVESLHNNGVCTTPVGTAVCASGVCGADNKCGYANNAGTCTSGNAGTVCRSSVCGNDNKCGYPNGTGTCTASNQSTVCRSGSCGSASGSCVPTGGSGCLLDGDCGSTGYCNIGALACVPKLANGSSIPVDAIHLGTCTTQTGAAVCTSGVCDLDNKCGYGNGDGTCDGTTAATVCRGAVCGADSKCGLPDGAGTCSALNQTTVCRSGTCGATSSLCVPAGGSGCALDTDCASGYCNGTMLLCVGKLGNDVALPVDTLHNGMCAGTLGATVCASGVCDSDNKCGFANGDGACTVGTASMVCRSGACGADMKCGFGDGTGTCTAGTAGVCRSGACSATSGTCVPGGGGGCAVDADCGAGKYCNGQTLSCVAKLANGSTLPSDGLHDGTCSSGAGTALCASGRCDQDGKCGVANGHGACTTGSDPVCRSGICDADSLCGYANGKGVCDDTTASNICRSGICGGSSKACVPSGGTGCALDGDCGAGKYCVFTTLTCAPLLSNGTTLPNDGLHNGACTPTLAQAVCASGSCDATDSKCGLGQGAGTCTATNQCRTGVCVLTGTNSGKCEPCNRDDDCGGSTAACDVVTNQCVSCTAQNATACTGTTPLCDLTTHACTACTADLAVTGTAHACSGSTTPFCGVDGSCGKCTSNAQCAGGTHGGPICNVNTGACGALCTTDADCPGKWCDNPTAAVGTGVCEAKVGDGKAVPTDAPVNGVCTTTVGQRVCDAGTCDTADNLCGLSNGRACSAASDCRSGICGADGHCGTGNGGSCVLAADCRSGVCGADLKCGANNGDHCGASSDCRGGICVAVDATCGALGGTSCTDAVTCRAGVCYTDGKCGLPNGETCTTGLACRSGACVAGLCASACTKDTECGSGAYCANGACAPTLVNGQTCDRDTACRGNVCAADGKCGNIDGTTCTADATCRNGACSGGQCGATCTANADCAAGFFCSASACVAAGPNGTTCTSGAACASGICNTDGKCGTPDGQPCATASVCRSGVCSGSLCGLNCASSAECAVGTFCDATTHACVIAVPNGMKPTGGTCTPDRCVSGICAADGTCGAATGDTCGASAACQAGACDPVDGKCGLDNGHGVCTATNGAQVCRTGACDTDGKCGLKDGDGPCMTTAATVCRSGMCGSASGKCVAMSGNGCEADGDCGTMGYCDGKTKTCTTKLANGSTIPSDGLHDGSCAGATLVCASGTCDPTDNTCGLGMGSGPCATDAGCRTGKCSPATMKCSACLADADCAASGTFCDLNAGSCKALLPQGATCDRAAQCTAATCASDKACGLPEGAACTATTECREGQCSVGVCRLAVNTGTTKDMVRISGGGGSCNIGGGGEGQLTGLFAFGALVLWAGRRRRGR